MTDQTRAEAEQALREVAQQYDDALMHLKAAETRANQEVFKAKNAGLSQHDIARIMGEHWASDHNPQFPPVTDLQRPPA